MTCLPSPKNDSNPSPRREISYRSFSQTQAVPHLIISILSMPLLHGHLFPFPPLSSGPWLRSPSPSISIFPPPLSILIRGDVFPSYQPENQFNGQKLSKFRPELLPLFPSSFRGPEISDSDLCKQARRDLLTAFSLRRVLYYAHNTVNAVLLLKRKLLSPFPDSFTAISPLTTPKMFLTRTLSDGPPLP